MSCVAEALENSQFLKSLYGSELSFSNVDLQEIRLVWDGPVARLLFDMNTFPEKHPAKWMGLNTVQVALSLFPLYEITVTKFSRGNKCDIEVSRLEDGLFRVYITGESIAMVNVMSVRVDKVSAYLRQA